MNSNLTVSDPLAEQAVTIVITLVAGERPRAERPALVSVGAAERPPALTAGLFGQLPSLIDAAWNAYGLQAQLTAAAPAEEEEATLVAEEVIDPAIPPAVPRPQAHNLSLF
ncbi:MAG: hypothetical protein IAE79_02730 [Anaerolinea sp.]|nr:hypothetical protein [Anaerolinea sp.]